MANTAPRIITERLELRLTADQKAQITELAERRGEPASAYIRRLIDAELRKVARREKGS